MRRSTLGLATRASSSLFLSSSSAASVASTRRRGVIIHHQCRFQHPAASFSSPASSSRTDIEPQVKPPSIPLMQRFLQVFGYGGSLKRTKYSESLLQSCIAQTNNTQFYRAGRISDSFRPSHGLLVAHVWMVHKRLLLEGEEGKVLEEALFDRLWEETTNRIRSLKVNELSVNSYVKEVQAYSFGACVSYDASQAIDNEQERLDELAGALYRYVYLRDEHLTEEHVLELAKYIQRELDSLKTLPKEAIFQSRFKWGPPPSWKKRLPRYITSEGRQLSDDEVLRVKREGEGDDASVASPSTAASAAVEEGKGGGDKKEEEEEEEGHVKGEWRTAFAEDGRMYYWNVRQRDNQFQSIMSAEEQTKKRKDVEGGEEEAPPAKRQEEEDEEEEENEEESVDRFKEKGEDVSEELPFSKYCTQCGKLATRMALLHGFNYKTGVCGSCQPLGEGDWGDDDDDEEYEGDEGGEEEEDEEDEDEEAYEEEGDDDGEEEEEDGEEEAGEEEEEEEDEEVAVAEEEEGLSKPGSAVGSGSRKVAVSSDKESQ